MKSWAVPSLFVSLAVIASCSSSGKSGGGGTGNTKSLEDAFTDALEIGVPNTPVVGPLPDGTSGGPQVTPLPGTAPLAASPSASLSFAIPWQGGAIQSINIGFGGSKYFSIPVPQAGSQSSGMITVPAKLGASVCDGLANTCHQIKCYEQVTLPDGKTVSKAAAMQIVLNCTGGSDCNGNPGDGGAGGGGGVSDPCGAIGTWQVTHPGGPICGNCQDIAPQTYSFTIDASISSTGGHPPDVAALVFDPKTCRVTADPSYDTTGCGSFSDVYDLKTGTGHAQAYCAGASCCTKDFPITVTKL